MTSNTSHDSTPAATRTVTLTESPALSPTTSSGGGNDFLARFAASRDHSKRSSLVDGSAVSARVKSLTHDLGLPFHKLAAPSLSATTPLAVLVACGSYSPITAMHLWLFENAKNYLMHECQQFDIVGGFISPVHDAYGKPSLVEARHRVAMIELSVSDSDWLACSHWEIGQHEWTRTAATLKTYSNIINTSQLYGNRHVSCLLLCGADLLESTLIPNLWHTDDLNLIFGQFGVAVIERVGLDLQSLIDSNALLRQYRDNIYIIPQRIVNNVSSTSVRTLITLNQSIKYLVPDAVAQYIYQHQLYGHDARTHQQRRQRKLIDQDKQQSSSASQSHTSNGSMNNRMDENGSLTIELKPNQ